MSDIISPYWHYVESFDVYPRVYYFRGRFIDFYRRFSNVLGNIPEDVHDDYFLSVAKHLNDALQKNYFCIIVYGKRDVPEKELFITTQSIKSLSIEKKTDKTGPPSPRIVVCYFELESVQGDHFEELEQTVKHFKSSRFYESFPLNFLILACKVNLETTDKEITKCRENIIRKMKSLLGYELASENVIISSKEMNIKQRVSDIYEQWIIEAFVRIRIFLGFFVKKDKQTRQTLSISDASFVTLNNVLSCILQNPVLLLDFQIEQSDENPSSLTHYLARHVRCSLISFFALKHALPTWFCTRICKVDKFESKLVESMSDRTRFIIGYLERICNKVVNDHHLKYLSRYFGSSNRLKIIVTSLQRDFESVSSTTEMEINSMKRIQTVMCKMEYEIDGYLKQTSVEHFDFSPKQPSIRIPDSLRRSVLKIEGVYGIGTIYDVIEVHLQESVPDTSSLIKRLQSMMKEYNLNYLFRVRQIKRSNVKTN